MCIRDRACRAPLARRQTPLGARHAQLNAGVVEHRKIGMTLALEHVAHGTRARRNGRRGRLRLNGGPDPRAQYLANAPTPGSGQAVTNAPGGARGARGMLRQASMENRRRVLATLPPRAFCPRFDRWSFARRGPGRAVESWDRIPFLRAAAGRAVARRSNLEEAIPPATEPKI